MFLSRNKKNSVYPCKPQFYNIKVGLKRSILYRHVFVMDNHNITKTRLYNFDPLKPHFYIVKLGFTGVCLIFLISAQNIDCGYSLEPPRRGLAEAVLMNTHNLCFWAEIWKNCWIFCLKIFNYSVISFSVYLNRHVFLMNRTLTLIVRRQPPETKWGKSRHLVWGPIHKHWLI